MSSSDYFQITILGLVFRRVNKVILVKNSLRKVDIKK